MWFLSHAHWHMQSCLIWALLHKGCVVPFNETFKQTTCSSSLLSSAGESAESYKDSCPTFPFLGKVDSNT